MRTTRILEWVSHSLLQGILPTRGLDPGLPHCRQILYCLSHQGGPKKWAEDLDRHFFFKKRHTDGQKVHEKMVDTTNY